MASSVSATEAETGVRRAKDARLYAELKRYVLTERELVENGYPRSSPGGVISIRASSMGPQTSLSRIPLRADERMCYRCSKKFLVTAESVVVRTETCVYHGGGLTKKRGYGASSNLFKCCMRSEGSAGCQTCESHVHRQNRLQDLVGYVKTQPAPTVPAGSYYGVYSVDCEMIYTTFGLELAQVTVVGTDNKPVLDKLVKPGHPVVDWNTRYSGITADMMKDVTTSIEDIQEELLSLFNDRTILIGHSLDSDLISLKMVHSYVIDTSVVFKVDPRYKRALKEIVLHTLQKSIQTGAGGHDSTEDATACMQLMIWKVNSH